MKLKFIVAILIAASFSGCVVCSSRKSELNPKAKVSSSDWGSQKKLAMRTNTKLRKGSAHGRVKMTKDRTSEMLSK